MDSFFYVDIDIDSYVKEQEKLVEIHFIDERY